MSDMNGTNILAPGMARNKYALLDEDNNRFLKIKKKILSLP